MATRDPCPRNPFTMSISYVPVIRKNNVIGSNIRSGLTPGGFTHNFGIKRHDFVRKKKDIYSDSREVKEAANRVLEKRGLINEPNELRDGHGGFRHY